MKIGHKLLGRYTIERLVGEGSTATVYAARDERLGRLVAVKVLLPYVRPTVKERFSREARSAAALNHPNIMAIYDEAQEEDYQFLIVEYVEGQPLSDFIPTTPDIIVNLGTQLCSALHYAHRMNIIHRDIKPANIKVSGEGLVKIMDFGLAKTKDATHITQHGSIIGTPAYLSPEQARGQELDHRTDIYSLGVVLYEMATGKLPFDSNDISVLLMQKVSSDPLRPRDVLPALPVWLDNAIMKAIQRERDIRYQSAIELAQALTQGQQQYRPTVEETPASVLLPPPFPDRPTEEAPMTDTEKRITVVLADDHLILRTSMAFFLNDQPDIKVLGEAGTGTEVLAILQEQQPDILLLDLNMPERGGLDILPEIRRLYPEVSILVLTGRTEEAYIIRALQAGAHGYLLKTSSQEELLDAIHRVAMGHMALGSDVTERVVSGLITPLDRDPLTDIERKVLLCIVGGAETNAAIASKLSLNEQDVVTHLKSAIDKLGAQSRAQAALIALRSGWITIEEAHQHRITGPT